MGTLAKGIQHIGIDRCHHRRYFGGDGLDEKIAFILLQFYEIVNLT
jgi:hypothetical protein